MYSSVSSPLPLAKSLFFPMISKPHFCSTLIDPMLSAALALRIRREIQSKRKALPQNVRHRNLFQRITSKVEESHTPNARHQPPRTQPE